VRGSFLRLRAPGLPSSVVMTKLTDTSERIKESPDSIGVKPELGHVSKFGAEGL